MNTTTARITKQQQQQFLPTIRGAAGEIETSAMANCLMLISSQHAAVASVANGGVNSEQEVGRMFACKTCDRKFSSFQALGGHRASHKKVKSPNSGEFSDEVSFPVKPKVHGCKICGVEFPTGQALGGHMRRHRENMATAAGGGFGVVSTTLSGLTTEGSMGSSDGNNDGDKKRKTNDDVVSEVPVLKKSSSSKRVCLDLDLSLTLWKKEEAAVEENEHHVVEAEEDEIEEGEIVEQREEERDFLKLELRQPINW